MDECKPLKLGTLKRIDIGIVPSVLAMADGWHLKMVAVANVADGKEIFFFHDDWLQAGTDTSRSPVYFF